MFTYTAFQGEIFPLGVSALWVKLFQMMLVPFAMSPPLSRSLTFLLPSEYASDELAQIVI